VASLGFSLRTKGVAKTLRRIGTVLAHYGLSPYKMAKKLEEVNEILQKHQCYGTFPITAVTLKKHHKLISSLGNLEIAVHGYKHTDYCRQSFQEQAKDIEGAMNIFLSCGLQTKGFRSPYFRWNRDTLRALKKFGFQYDSSTVLFWNVLDGQALRENSIKKAINAYQPKSSENCLSLPWVEDGIVRLPVSIPDDEMIVERLNIRRSEEIVEIWKKMLLASHKRGDLLVLQLHPERIELFSPALEEIIEEAKARNVWIASLAEIASWWKERRGFRMKVGEGYKIDIECSDRARVLYGGEEVQKSFTATRNPSVGISPDLNIKTKLEEWGYHVVESNDSEGFEAYVRDFHNNEPRLLEELKGKRLVRIALWPRPFESALSISGDIDAMTIWEYAQRVFSP